MVEFYLVLSPTRMDPTFGAEGDYDNRSCEVWTRGDGQTAFTLAPDDHPETIINGVIYAKADSQLVTVTLKNIPDSSSADRSTFYCRFEDPKTET